MEDAYLNEPLTKRQQISNIDNYVDFYLDSLAWYEGNWICDYQPTYETGYNVEGIQYL